MRLKMFSISNACQRRAKPYKNKPMWFISTMDPTSNVTNLADFLLNQKYLPQRAYKFQLLLFRSATNQY